MTLPQAVCNAVALQHGDYVEVFARDGVAHIIKINSDYLAGRFNYLIKDREFPSVEEMKKAIKKHVANKLVTDDCN